MVPVELLWLWEGFEDVATCRPDGFAALRRIPTTSMLEYLARRGVEDQLWDHAIEVWRAMDGRVIELASPTTKPTATPTPGDSGRVGIGSGAVGRSVVADEDYPEG